MTTNPTPDPVKEMPTPRTDEHITGYGVPNVRCTCQFNEGHEPHCAVVLAHELAAANLLLEAEKQRRIRAELAYETDCEQLQAEVEQAESRCEALRECLKGCVKALGEIKRHEHLMICSCVCLHLLESALKAATALLGDGVGQRPFLDTGSQNGPEGTDAGGQS